MKDTALTSTKNMFYGINTYKLSNLEEIKGLENLNTKNVKSTAHMFHGCSALTELDLSAFDFTSVTYASSMFEGCTKLKTIYCKENLSVKSEFTALDMFKGCTSLEGENGTKCDGTTHVDASYARIDKGESEKGYFTENKPEGSGGGSGGSGGGNGGNRGLDDVQADGAQGAKVLIDGQIYIRYNGQLYNLQGARVK
jgi:surface protein